MWKPCPSVHPSLTYYQCCRIFKKFSTSVFYKTLSNKREFHGSRFSNFTSRLKSIYTRNFLISWPIWVKFGIGYSNIMLSFICQFRDSQRRGVRSLVMASLKLLHVCTIKPYNTLKVKNALMKSTYYVTGYTIFTQ